MSAAQECDVCGSLYLAERGALTLDVYVPQRKDPAILDTWSDVDLCPKCGAKVLAIIRGALLGFRR